LSRPEPIKLTVPFAALLALFAREAGAARERILVLGLDNAGWHTAPNLVVPDGMRLVYLPRYSPELQPAEHLWPVLDEPLANRYFVTLADLEHVVTERCRILNRDQLKPGTNFHCWPKPAIPASSAGNRMIPPKDLRSGASAGTTEHETACDRAGGERSRRGTH
jgi:transposase